MPIVSMKQRPTGLSALRWGTIPILYPIHDKSSPRARAVRFFLLCELSTSAV
jgi:hypothetical protein